jgi:hypothetical protein
MNIDFRKAPYKGLLTNRVATRLKSEHGKIMTSQGIGRSLRMQNDPLILKIASEEIKKINSELKKAKSSFNKATEVSND